MSHLEYVPSADPARAARLNAATNAPREPVTSAEIWRGVRYGLLALPLLLAAALGPAWFSFGLKLPWWATILAAIPMGALPALLTIALVRRVAAQRIARHFARAGYCGSCGQDLTGLERAADQCCVCPECGAAWR